MFFSFVNSSGSYTSDLTSVTWGTLPLLSGGDVETIYYLDLVAGTGIFEAASTSLGTWNCGLWPEPVGYFSAYPLQAEQQHFSP